MHGEGVYTWSDGRGYSGFFGGHSVLGCVASCCVASGWFGVFACLFAFLLSLLICL